MPRKICIVIIVGNADLRSLQRKLNVPIKSSLSRQKTKIIECLRCYGKTTPSHPR